MSEISTQEAAAKAVAEKEAKGKDDAYKSRIIRHMNADHQDSVSRYLQHYGHFSPFRARNAQLEDVSLESITIIVGRHRKVIPLEPKMKNYQEARGRLIEMDQEARAALGQSDITINEYARPRGFGLFMLAFSTAYGLCFYSKSNFEPGALFHDWYAPKYPWLINLFHQTQPIFYAAILIHVFETEYFERTRLRVHGVRWWTLLWWKYIVTQFMEGWTSIVRFDRLVDEKLARKAAAKH